MGCKFVFYPFALSCPRITSYNVCYTKLLRILLNGRICSQHIGQYLTTPLEFTDKVSLAPQDLNFLQTTKSLIDRLKKIRTHRLRGDAALTRFLLEYAINDENKSTQYRHRIDCHNWVGYQNDANDRNRHQCF